METEPQLEGPRCSRQRSRAGSAPSRITIKNPACSPVQCCPRVPWIKLGLILPLVIYYHHIKQLTKDLSKDNSDYASLVFLTATSVWLSTLNLQLRSLKFYAIFKNLKWIYDVLAVTIISHLLLDTVWAQMKVLMNAVTTTIYQYLEESYLADYLYDWVEWDDFGCVQELAVATFYALWVADSCCLLDPIKYLFWCAYCSWKY